MTKFEKVCEKLHKNFSSNAGWCYFAPRTPGFTRPKGTKYLAYLNAMMEKPLPASKIESKTTQQSLRWSGLCVSTKEGYILTKLGKEYLNLANEI